jgi:hypothetical protein
MTTEQKVYKRAVDNLNILLNKMKPMLADEDIQELEWNIFILKSQIMYGEPLRAH